MGLSHAELRAKGDEQVALLLAYAELQQETGPLGQWMPEATSDAADPEIYDHPNPVRYVPTHYIDHAEAAAERYRKENELPPGAVVIVERRTYGTASPDSP